MNVCRALTLASLSVVLACGPTQSSTQSLGGPGHGGTGSETDTDAGVISLPDGGTGVVYDDGGVGPVPDAGTVDAGDPNNHLGSCTPDPGWQGNSKEVGMYCTKGGGQCKGNSFADTCAIDVDSRGNNFCIHIGCTKSSSCGEAACCHVTSKILPFLNACIPVECEDNGVCSS